MHPSGKHSFTPRELVPGVFLEVHASAPNLIARAKKYLGHYGVSYEVLEG